MYRIIILVKQVPDTKTIIGEAMKPDGTINRSALPTIFNPEDLHALEMALEVKERYGAEIHVLTMGPSSAMDVLRESLFRGADYAYLISDKHFAAADTLATSYTLSMSIKKIEHQFGKIDLIFCGRQAIDGDTAQVGPQVAQNLAFPQITYAEELIDSDREEKTITIKRQVEGGYEILKGKMPLLVTVVDTAPRARPRDIARTVQMRKTVIPVWGVGDIGADVSLCGLSGSPTNVYKIHSVNLSVGDRQANLIDIQSGGIEMLVEKIIAGGFVKGVGL